MKSVVLKYSRERSLLRHHPWVFSGAIERETDAGLGETVQVESFNGEILGFGSYSPNSQIRVRMLTFDKGVVPDASLIANRVKASVSKRASFLACDSTTNACRLINAESDLLPGVVADYYDGHIVLQLTSAGAEFWRDAIIKGLKACGLKVGSISERQDVEVRKKEGLSCADALVLHEGNAPELITIKEDKIRYFVDIRQGHKTGFYLDQRDARKAVGELAAGRTVLNCFAYTGGFGLAAAMGGATKVTQVDISESAIKLAQKNAELSGVNDGIIEYVTADVFEYLRKCRDEGKTFDLIVLDPPKFAAVKSQIMKASRGYKDINLLAMKLLAKDGILATFSCSGAMDKTLFNQIVAEAATDANRDFQVLANTRQAVDHPVAVSFPEGAYLKGMILRSL